MHHTQSQTTYRQTDHQTSCSSCCLPKDRGRWSAWSLQCWSQCQTVLQFHALLFFWVWLLSNIHGSESLMCQTIYFLLTNFGDLSWNKSWWSSVPTVGEIYHAKFCYKIHCCAASVCSCCIDGGHGQLSPVSQYYNISNVDFTIIFLYPCDPSFLTFWILTLRLLFKTSMRYTTQTLYEMYIRTELDGIPDEIRYGPCIFFYCKSWTHDPWDPNILQDDFLLNLGILQFLWRVVLHEKFAMKIEHTAVRIHDRTNKYRHSKPPCNHHTTCTQHASVKAHKGNICTTWKQ